MKIRHTIQTGLKVNEVLINLLDEKRDEIRANLSLDAEDFVGDTLNLCTAFDVEDGIYVQVAELTVRSVIDGLPTSRKFSGWDYIITDAMVDRYDLAPLLTATAEDVAVEYFKPFDRFGYVEEGRVKILDSADYLTNADTPNVGDICTAYKIYPKGTLVYIIPEGAEENPTGVAYTLLLNEQGAGRVEVEAVDPTTPLTWLPALRSAPVEPVEKQKAPVLRSAFLPDDADLCNNHDAHYKEAGKVGALPEPIEALEQVEAQLINAGVEVNRVCNIVRGLKYILRADLKANENVDKEIHKFFNYVHRARTGKWLGVNE